MIIPFIFSTLHICYQLSYSLKSLVLINYVCLVRKLLPDFTIKYHVKRAKTNV